MAVPRKVPYPKAMVKLILLARAACQKTGVRAASPRAWTALGLGLALAACGTNATPPAESPLRLEKPASEAAGEAEPMSPPEASPASEATKVAGPESTNEVESAASPDPKPASEKKTQSGHDVIYRVSPEGMVIIALDTEFHPTATVKRVQGGYVVNVRVEVEPGKSVELLAGKDGPLALSARVRRPAEEFHHDERGDSKIISLGASETKTYERTFPSLPLRPLSRSQEAELRFGLWGIGRNEEDRLPIKKFFTVRVVVDQKGARVTLDTPAGTETEE
jgi:hypothetical protein